MAKTKNRGRKVIYKNKPLYNPSVDYETAYNLKKYGIIIIIVLTFIGFIFGVVSMVVEDYYTDSPNKFGIFRASSGGRACMGDCPTSDSCSGITKCEVDKSMSILSSIFALFVITTITVYFFSIVYGNKGSWNHKFNCGDPGISVRSLMVISIIAAFFFQFVAIMNQTLGLMGNNRTISEQMGEPGKEYGSGFYLSLFATLCYMGSVLTLLLMYVFYMEDPESWARVCVN